MGMHARGKVARTSSDIEKGNAASSSATSSVTTAAVNLTKNLVGAGIFSLPAALHRGSVVPGVSAMMLVGFLCGSTFVLIAFLCSKLGSKTYRDVFSVAFGSRSAVLVDLCIFTNGFFALASIIPRP